MVVGLIGQTGVSALSRVVEETSHVTGHVSTLLHKMEEKNVLGTVPTLYLVTLNHVKVSDTL